MTKYKGKKVLIAGFGKTGQAAATFLCRQGALVWVTDTKSKNDFSEAMKAIEEFEVQYEFGKFNEKSFTSCDYLVLSPGIPRSLPEVQSAIQAGVPVISDLDIFADQCKVPIIAVTGTNGKTTTTTLISEMLIASGRKVFTGGNIGIPALQMINENIPADVVVLEVSSFQCESIQTLKPATVVLTNLEPDHLDRYTNVEEYYLAKKRLIRNLDSNCQLILNIDNPTSMKWAEQTKAQVLYFTKKDLEKELTKTGAGTLDKSFIEKYNGSYLRRPKMIAKMANKETVFEMIACRLPGDHNRENFMAATNAALLHGANQQGIQRVINEFRGVAHRLEFIRKKDGVSMYNDSKATNIASVIRSLNSFNAPIILIAGGRDKDQDFTPLVELVKKKVKNLILVGEAKEKINRVLGDFSETFLVGTFEEAVLLAYQKSRNGDVILFSPACASYDMFRNYEERGECFIKLVTKL